MSERLFDKAQRAAVLVRQLDADVAAARESLGHALHALHGIAPVRSVARETGLSAVTVSNLWRGHVCATPDNIMACLRAARFEVRP